MAPRARRSTASRQKRCAPLLPSTGHTGIAVPSVSPRRAPTGLPAFSRWIAIFFAELSQVGCRTRGVDGRLVHPALGQVRRGQLLLTEPDLLYLLVNTGPRAAKHRIAARCNRSPGCSLPRQQPPASASRSKAANTKGNPAAAPRDRRRRASITRQTPAVYRTRQGSAQTAARANKRP